MHYFQNSIVLYLISNDDSTDGDDTCNTSVDGETVVEEACEKGAVVEVAVVVTGLTGVTVNSALGEAFIFFLDSADDVSSDAGGFNWMFCYCYAHSPHSLSLSFSSFSSLADPRRTLT